MKDAIIRGMQWAQDRVRASQLSRLAEHNQEHERKKRKKGIVVICIQWALRGAGVYWQSSHDEVQQYEERKRRKRERDKRITLAIAILMAALYLFSLSPLGAHSSTAQRQDPAMAMDKTYAAIRAFIQPYNKAVTLRNGTSAALTAYPPAAGSNALSSSTIDEQTGNLSYIRGMGKGDETSTEMVVPPPPPRNTGGNSNGSNGSNGSNTSGGDNSDCNGYSKTVSAGGNNQSLSIPSCINYQADPKDFMTGTQCTSDQICGIVLQFPTLLTTGNKIVQNALGAMQIIGLACITPLLALIGLNILNGAITSRYANGVEALSRLIPAAIGIAFSLELVNFVLQIEGDFVQVILNLFGNPDLSSFIPPANTWQSTLLDFLIVGIVLVTAQSVAPLLIEVLGSGFTIGPFIAIAVELAAKAFLIAEIPHLILVILSMVLCTQYLMRIVLVNFYIILSPLAIAAAVAPGQDGVGFTREWIMGLLSLLASQFAQAMVLLLGVQMLGSLQVNDMVSELIKYGTFTLMLRTPGLFKSNAAGMVSQVGASAVGVVTGPYLAFM
jgi:hypothetical protein